MSEINVGVEVDVDVDANDAIEVVAGVDEEKLDNSQMKHLVYEISNLSINEMKEVFKILDKSGIKYTENSNGIYFVLSHVPNDILVNIKKFLIFCQNNKETLDSIDSAQLNEKNNMDKTVKEVTINNTTCSTDTKYVAKITHQNELDKYGLNLDEKEVAQPESEEIDIALNKTKMKYAGIKSKIIKSSNKSGGGGGSKSAKPKPLPMDS